MNKNSKPPEPGGRTILVVEDEPALRELLRVNLARAGYAIELAADPLPALQLLQRRLPDLILVDWNMPHMSGLDFVRTLRQKLSVQCPVIMVTARCAQEDTLAAFEAGVDDFVSKPFHMRELLARIESKLRWHNLHEEASSGPLELDGLALYPAQQVATVQGRRIELGPQEFQLLLALAQRPDHVMSRERLVAQVFSDPALGDERAIDALVLRLRRKLEREGHYRCIAAVRSVGYRFVGRAEASPAAPAAEAERAEAAPPPGASPWTRSIA